MLKVLALAMLPGSPLTVPILITNVRAGTSWPRQAPECFPTNLLIYHSVTSRNDRSKNHLLLLFSTVYSGVRMVVYEHLRDSVLGRAEDESFPLW